MQIVRRTLFFLLSILPSIVGAQPRLPTVLVFERQDFEGRPFISVGDALRSLTSLNIERAGGRQMLTTAKFRGTSQSERVSVLLDGRPLNGDFDGQVDMSQIPISIVDRLEVTLGGAPHIYTAESVAGTVNIITVRPGQDGLDVKLGTLVGRHGTKDSTGQFFGRSNLADITYVASKEELSGFSDNEDEKQTNHFANISRSFSGKGFWGVEYFYHDANRGQTLGTPIPFSDWNGMLEKSSLSDDLQDHFEWQYVKGTVSSPKTRFGTFHFNLAASQIDKEQDSGSGTPKILDTKNRNSWSHLRYELNRLNLSVDMQSFDTDLGDFGTHHRNQLGGYASYSFDWEEWKIMPSIRADDHSLGGAFTAPRLSVYRELGLWTLSSSMGRSFRAPTNNELFVSSSTIKNSSLRLEKAHAYDVGLSYSGQKGAFISLSGFSRVINDAIIPETSGGAWKNVGREKNMGAEFRAMAPLFKKICFKTDWIMQSSQLKGGDNSRYVDSPMTPKYLGRMIAEWQLNRSVLFSNDVVYKSDQYEYSNRNGKKIGGHSVWNARIKVNILKADLFFAVDNILKKRYSESIAASSGLYPQPSRIYWAGASIRFLN